MCDLRQHRRYTDRQIKDALIEAVSVFVVRDRNLLERALYEPAMTHRIAIYLEPLFPTYDVDCEYDRNGAGPKATEEYGNMRPDIIVHCREHNHPWNLLAIEAKKVDTAYADDLVKLRGLKTVEPFRYQVVAFVRLGTSGALIDFGDEEPTPVGMNVPARARPGTWLTNA